MVGTMLSLFDGSGGFGLAGRLVGIEPVMASEVKPYPITYDFKEYSNIGVLEGTVHIVEK